MDQLREEYADTPPGYQDDLSRERNRTHIERVREECRLMGGGEVTTQPFPEYPFAGRKQELAAVRESLHNNARIILISGIGGIGKTALMTAYARWEEAFYDTVLFLPAGNGVRKAVIDDTILKISGLRWSERRYHSNQHYYREKMKVLNRLTQKRRVLVMVDDLKSVRLRELTALLEMPADFLITSRLTAEAFVRLPESLRPFSLSLKEMSAEEQEELAVLLRPDLSGEKQILYQNFCCRMQGHTLALKQWLVSDGKLPEIDADGRLVFLDQQIGPSARLFLMALSVLPPEGVSRAWAERMCSVKEDITESLAQRSLVQLEGSRQSGMQRVSLHPLIAENVRRILQPDMKKCRHFLENVAADVGNAWNRPREEMLLQLPAVQNILAFFSEYPPWMTSVLDRLFTFLWVMEDFEGAERGYAGLFESVQKTWGEPAQETGWMAVRFGAVYHNSFRFDEAERWYKRGLDNLRRCRRRNKDYWWQRMEACGKCTRAPMFRGETGQVLELLQEAEELYHLAPEEARSDRLLLIEAYHSRRQASFFLKLGRMEAAQNYRNRMHEEMKLYFFRCGIDIPKQLDLRETDIEFERTLGNLRSATELLEENLRGFLVYRGPEHEDTLHCKEQMAEILFLKGQQAESMLTEEAQNCFRQSRELYLQIAAGLHLHYPHEHEWLRRVEERIRNL